jgi:PIN domain nuclease of toxin-antitoxin system
VGCGSLILLDTHTWLWWTGGLPGLSKRAAAEIERADRIGVCTISCWEVATLVRLGRVKLGDEVRAWVRRALAVDRVEALGLGSDTAVAAALLPDGFPGDPGDRIIYATARAYDAPLLTKDRRLRAYDRTRTLW